MDVHETYVSNNTSDGQHHNLLQSNSGGSVWKAIEPSLTVPSQGFSGICGSPGFSGLNGGFVGPAGMNGYSGTTTEALLAKYFKDMDTLIQENKYLNEMMTYLYSEVIQLSKKLDKLLPTETDETAENEEGG